MKRKESIEPEGDEFSLLSVDSEQTGMNELEEEIEENIEEAQAIQDEYEAEENKDEPQWDGSESDVIVDDEAEIFEDKYAGIGITYTLTKKEIFTTIKQLDYVKGRMRKNIIYAVLLCGLSVLFLCSYLYFDKSSMSLFISVITFVVAIIQVLLFYGELNGKIKEHDDKIPMELEIFPNEINVTKKNNKRKIILDRTSEFAEIDDIFMIFTSEEKITAIPKRSIEPAYVAEVESIITAGTSPKK